MISTESSESLHGIPKRIIKNVNCAKMKSDADAFTSVGGQKFSVNFRQNRIGPKIVTDFVIGDRKFEVRVDEGSMISVVSPEFLSKVTKSIHKEYMIPPVYVTMPREQITLTRFVELVMTHQGQETLWGFHVMPGFKGNILVGTDWTKRHINLKLCANEESLCDPEIKSSLSTDFVPDAANSKNKLWKFSLVQTVSIPPWNAKRVKIQCPDIISGSVILSPNRDLQFKDRIIQPYVYAVIEGNCTDTWITNLTRRPLTLHKKTVVAFGESCVDGANVMLLSEGDSKVENGSQGPEPEKDFGVNLGDNLTLKEKKEILNLIVEFSDVFVTEETQVGKTDLFRHKIDTGNHPPIRMHPYRASFVERGKIKEKVQ